LVAAKGRILQLDGEMAYYNTGVRPNPISTGAVGSTIPSTPASVGTTQASTGGGNGKQTKKQSQAQTAQTQAFAPVANAILTSEAGTVGGS
jgi:hypothetical protein